MGNGAGVSPILSILISVEETALADTKQCRECNFIFIILRGKKKVASKRSTCSPEFLFASISFLHFCRTTVERKSRERCISATLIVFIPTSDLSRRMLLLLLLICEWSPKSNVFQWKAVQEAFSEGPYVCKEGVRPLSMQVGLIGVWLLH